MPCRGLSRRVIEVAVAVVAGAVSVAAAVAGVVAVAAAAVSAATVLRFGWLKVRSGGGGAPHLVCSPPPPFLLPSGFPPRQGDVRGSADARSSADACLSKQKVQRREANRRRHRPTEPTTRAVCHPPPLPPAHAGPTKTPEQQVMEPNGQAQLAEGSGSDTECAFRRQLSTSCSERDVRRGQTVHCHSRSYLELYVHPFACCSIAVECVLLLL